MSKKYFSIALAFFIGFTVKDLLFYQAIQWGYNISITIIAPVIYFLVDWANKPYEWKKNKK